jgi:hypothetical protein
MIPPHMLRQRSVLVVSVSTHTVNASSFKKRYLILSGPTCGNRRVVRLTWEKRLLMQPNERCAKRQVLRLLQSLIGMRHLLNFRFGKGDLYLLAICKVHTSDADKTPIAQASETGACKWMIDMQEYLSLHSSQWMAWCHSRASSTRVAQVVPHGDTILPTFAYAQDRARYLASTSNHRQDLSTTCPRSHPTYIWQ